MFLCVQHRHCELSVMLAVNVLSLLTFAGAWRHSRESVLREECILDPNQQKFNLSTIEILKIRNYPFETHYVTSEDGYIIEIHRMPAPGSPVVYLLPGIFQSSRDFLMNCHERSLAEKVYAAGYDVWLGNFRGNTYGRNHSTLPSNSRKFWEFGTDQMIAYDVPAAIDYVLSQTGEAQLNWVGFSLGNTILFGFLSTRPEYSRKIKLATTIGGPAVYFNSTPAGPVRVLSRNRASVQALSYSVLNGELPPQIVTSLLYQSSPKLCQREARRRSPGVCLGLFNLLDGRDVSQVNWAQLPLIFGGFPSPTSARVVTQWFQWIETGAFSKYDFGEANNKQVYGTSVPPTYDISKVTVPLLVFRADNDFLTPIRDIERAVAHLPNVVENIHVAWPNWTHLDYMYGKDADVLVYDFILNALKIYNGNAMKRH